MAVPLLQVDAFTDRPFRGNPAAVCLLDGEQSSSWMQQVAAEMNLSETAFLVPRPPQETGGATNEYDLRWFTPKVEVDLCGHATLAAAFALWHDEHLPASSAVRFHTRSGELEARQRGEWIELDFPAQPQKRADPPPALLEALGVVPSYVGFNGSDYLLEVEDESTVRGLEPDMQLLGCVDCRGVMVTSRASVSEFDFISRFFAPAVGIDEDPVTGSAHCCLGPYWMERLRKTELLAFQASPRGGVVRVSLEGNRVLLGGKAVLVLRGSLL